MALLLHDAPVDVMFDTQTLQSKFSADLVPNLIEKVIKLVRRLELVHEVLVNAHGLADGKSSKCTDRHDNEICLDS